MTTDNEHVTPDSVAAIVAEMKRMTNATNEHGSIDAAVVREWAAALATSAPAAEGGDGCPCGGQFVTACLSCGEPPEATPPHVGQAEQLAWQNIETAEVEFLNNLAEKGGLGDPLPGMLRHCARLIVSFDIRDRFKLAARTLIRGERDADGKLTRPLYAEDVETLVDVLHVLEALASHPARSPVQAGEKEIKAALKSARDIDDGVARVLAIITPQPAQPSEQDAVAISAETAADILTRYNALAPSSDHWPPERGRELRVEAMRVAATNALASAPPLAGQREDAMPFAWRVERHDGTGMYMAWDRQDANFAIERGYEVTPLLTRPASSGADPVTFLRDVANQLNARKDCRDFGMLSGIANALNGHAHILSAVLTSQQAGDKT